jgi:hypothetical protein
MSGGRTAAVASPRLAADRLSADRFFAHRLSADRLFPQKLSSPEAPNQGNTP